MAAPLSTGCFCIGELRLCGGKFILRRSEIALEIGVGTHRRKERLPQCTAGDDIGRIMHSSDDAIPADLTAAIHQGVALFGIKLGENTCE